MGHGYGISVTTKDTMSAERRQRLDAIGFVWDPHESAWEEGFAALTTFKAREGHCRVPDVTSKERSSLEQWVGRSAPQWKRHKSPLNEGSGWMPSDLFGIRSKAGKKALRR